MLVPTCEVLWIQTNDSIVAARVIPAASASSFPSVTVTSITEGLSLTQNHSGCWPYSLCDTRRLVSTRCCFSLSELFYSSTQHRKKKYPGIVFSTCPLHTNSGWGKERRILIGPWIPVAPVAQRMPVTAERRWMRNPV